jgi:ABC-type oligopeptide transport system ATPase subunit
MESKLERLRREAKERLAKISTKPIELDKETAEVLNDAVDGILVNSQQVLENATVQKYGFNPYVMPNGLILNEQQRKAVDWFGLEGKSGCLIGPAGTGKTTTMKAVIRAAVMAGRIPIIESHEEHKYMPTGTPGIWGGSFTRIATRNLRDNFPDDLKSNVHTIHRLLEFEPVVKEVEDGKGGIKKIRIFVPTRNASRTLPDSYMMFNFDEGSMVGCLLHTYWENARGNKKAQALYIGDIAQLPPVMDDSILGYKLLELPTVELTEVYRHAGAIVNLANHIRVGKTIPYGREIIPYVNKPTKAPKKLIQDAINEWNKEEDGSKVTIHLWKNRLEGEVGQLRALQSLGHYNDEKKAYGFFPKEIKEGRYDPLKHMILIPYNKAVGTIELNKYIAQYLGRHRPWTDSKGIKHEAALVHEVIAGFNKLYLAEGDKVFYDREEAIIVKINKNGTYSGKVPQPASVSLDRWGHNQVGQEETLDNDEMNSIDNMLLSLNTDIDDDERKNQASHVIHIKKLIDLKEEESGELTGAREYILNTASELNNLIFGYALTVHKSQGSQWEKVYCVFHCSHNRNLQRELLYTAITRAQKELYVICEPETFIQGVLSQHITGNTLAQKAEYFKGKKEANDRKKDLFNQQQEDNNEELK